LNAFSGYSIIIVMGRCKDDSWSLEAVLQISADGRWRWRTVSHNSFFSWTDALRVHTMVMW